MADAMKMSETVYARYEAVKTWPSIGSLRRLCQLLNCSAGWLLALDELQERGRLPPPDHDNRKNRGRLPPPDDDE